MNGSLRHDLADKEFGMNQMNGYPIIFVHGILGWGPKEAGFGDYWGRAHDVAEAKKDILTIKFASVGPISSYWDRARELFYQIKGGGRCVYKCDDYDIHHIHNEPQNIDKQKLESVHKWQKGEAPLYSNWDENNPIHLVGHSQGAWTILLLQYMLEQGNLFPGHKTSARWIRSVTSISGVLNGTTAPYAVCNFDEKTGYYKGTLNPFILNRRLAVNFLGLTPTDLLKTCWYAFKNPNSNLGVFTTDLIKIFETGGYNWDLDQWKIKRGKYLTEGGTLEILFNIAFLFRLNFKDFVYGQDSAAYSLSVIGTKEINKLFKAYDCTTYFSFVTQQNPRYYHFFLKRFGKGISKYSIKKLIKTKHWPQKTKLWPKEAEVEEYWQRSDGLVPIVSQYYPWLGVEEENHFNVKDCDDKGKSILFWPNDPQAGVWYMMRHVLKGWDHTDIVMFPQSKENVQLTLQFLFYNSLCKNLNNLKPLGNDD